VATEHGHSISTHVAWLVKKKKLCLAAWAATGLIWLPWLLS
jgi:hypothetical protein